MDRPETLHPSLFTLHYPRMVDWSVAEIMTKPVMTSTPGQTIKMARRLMRQAHIRHLPVLDEEDLLAGIISDRDLRDVRDDLLTVSEVMTRPVFVLSPETPLRQAARIFRERRIGAMPVLEGRVLVGIISIVDVLRILSE